jgi:hypothetical protein
MSQQSWEEMEAGWVRRFSEKTKRVTYARPREGGRIRIVSQRWDLREGEEGLGDILWPLAHKKDRQEEDVMEEPEMGEAQEVDDEAEGLMERAEMPADAAEEAMEQVELEVGEEAEEAGEMLEIKMEHKEELKKMAAARWWRRWRSSRASPSSWPASPPSTAPSSPSPRRPSLCRARCPPSSSPSPGWR